MKRIINFLILSIIVISCSGDSPSGPSLENAVWFYYSNFPQNENDPLYINRIDVNTGTKQALIKNAFLSHQPQAGKLLYTTMFEFEPGLATCKLHIANTDGSGSILVEGMEYGCGGHLLSPDGNKIAYTNSSYLKLFDINEKTAVTISKMSDVPASNPHFYSFSNDGRKIVYAIEQSGVYVYDIESGTNTQYYDETGYFDVNWNDCSENGDKVLIYDSDVYISSDNGSKIEKILDFEDTDISFMYFFDNDTKIVYDVERSNDLEDPIPQSSDQIYTCNIDGSDNRLVTKDISGWSLFRWDLFSENTFISDNEVVLERSSFSPEDNNIQLVVLNLTTGKSRVLKDNIHILYTE